MKSYSLAVATLGLLSFVSCHVIRDEVFPVTLPEVYIPRKIYTGVYTAAQNITPVRDGSRQADLCSCGSSTATKIAGGTEASVGEIPWTVQINTGEIKGGTINGIKCGATILNPGWLLTAAHCFDKMEPNDIIFVSAGGVSDATWEYAEVAKRLIKHNSYNSTGLVENDIALVELQTDLDFNNRNIATACLPYRLAGQTERKAKVVASGWGRTTDGGAYSPTLRKVTLDVIGNKKCQNVYWGERIFSTQMCTYTVNKDTCKGDSGSSIDEKIDGKWYAVGVVSFGAGCNRENEATVNTRVSEYTSWIEQNTGISNFCKV